VRNAGAIGQDGRDSNIPPRYRWCLALSSVSLLLVHNHQRSRL
jgi:hypothetical protein